VAMAETGKSDLERWCGKADVGRSALCRARSERAHLGYGLWPAILAEVGRPKRFRVLCSQQLFHYERGAVTVGFAQIAAAFLLAEPLCMRQRMRRKAWGDCRYD